MSDSVLSSLFNASRGKIVLIVFDGQPPPATSFGSNVRFAGRARTADDVILETLREQLEHRGAAFFGELHGAAGGGGVGYAFSGGEVLESCTILTTSANRTVRKVHHRMPVILEAQSATDWLAGSTTLLDDVAAITPALQAWPVDRRVNNARNEGEDLIRATGDVLR